MRLPNLPPQHQAHTHCIVPTETSFGETFAVQGRVATTAQTLQVLTLRRFATILRCQVKNYLQEVGCPSIAEVGADGASLPDPFMCVSHPPPFNHPHHPLIP